MSDELNCLRCDTKLEWTGTRGFHEGFFTGVLTKHAKFDVYLCPDCGHVEFFAEEVGQQLRPLNPW